MRHWTKKEIKFLEENYSKNISLESIANSIKKTSKAITRKAQREGLSRPRFPSNKPSKRTPKNILDRRYYLKNKEKVFERKMSRRRKIKEEIVKLMGGKCVICGYNKCISAFDFHHKGNKSENIAVLLKNESREKSLKESKKCILVCANCHRELHHKGP